MQEGSRKKKAGEYEKNGSVFLPHNTGNTYGPYHFFIMDTEAGLEEQY